MFPQRKKAPRLASFSYTGHYAYFITCTTHGRKTYFTSAENISLVLPYLTSTCSAKEFILYVYCFMPDHLHFLIAGDNNSVLTDLVKSFKQQSGYHFKRSCGLTLWQKGYYEHVLRRDEALKDAGLYILNNPVRAGIVDDFKKYPYCGSEIFDLSEL
jgi:putative transposase